MTPSFVFRGLPGLLSQTTKTKEFVRSSPVVAVSSGSNFIVGADSANMGFGVQSDRLEIGISATGSVNARPSSVRVIGLNRSHVFMRQFDDVANISPSTDSVTGTVVATCDSFISGNSGNDVITMRAAGGSVRRWGERAVVFGGAGNDSVTGIGAAVDCYIQMGVGNDRLSIGEHTSTATTKRWTRPSDGKLMPYGVIRGGDGMDTIHFQHLSGDQFRSQYRPATNGPNSFTLGGDGTAYMEFEFVSFNDGSTKPLPLVLG